MNSANQIGKVIAVMQFFLCAHSIVYAKYLTYGHGFDQSVRLKLSKIENETKAQEFELFDGFDAACAFISKDSTFAFDPKTQPGLSSEKFLSIVCCKGSYLPVFIQDGGYQASGSVDEGFEGPFFVSMWLSIPNAAQSNKVRIRYQVKKNSVGTIGVRIGKQGDYRLVAYENVKFIKD